MLVFAETLPNRADAPLEIGPGALLKMLLERGLLPEVGDADTHVNGPSAVRFSGLLAQGEAELVRRGIHAIPLFRGEETSRSYRDEGLRAHRLRVWRDERIITDVVKPGEKAAPKPGAKPVKKPTRRKQAA
jgi:hypothetical protein